MTPQEKLADIEAARKAAAAYEAKRRPCHGCGENALVIDDRGSWLSPDEWRCNPCYSQTARARRGRRPGSCRRCGLFGSGENRARIGTDGALLCGGCRRWLDADDIANAAPAFALKDRRYEWRVEPYDRERAEAGRSQQRLVRKMFGTRVISTRRVS